MVQIAKADARDFSQRWSEGYANLEDAERKKARNRQTLFDLGRVAVSSFAVYEVIDHVPGDPLPVELIALGGSVVTAGIARPGTSMRWLWPFSAGLFIGSMAHLFVKPLLEGGTSPGAGPTPQTPTSQPAPTLPASQTSLAAYVPTDLVSGS